MSRSLLAAGMAGMLLLASAGAAEESTPVEYPDGYRDWFHVKSMVILPGHALEDPFGGIHHIYANHEALAGLESGDYADGAVFVFDLLSAEEGADAIQEGERKLVGVMEKDAERFAATGGWGFEGFAGDSTTERLVADGGESCFACHQARQDAGYVFTELRD